MMSGKKPIFRVVFRTKDGKKFDIGAAWPGKFDDSHNLTFQRGNVDGQYPKMEACEAIRRCNAGEGWISINRVRDAQNTSFAAPAQSKFHDDDVPF